MPIPLRTTTCRRCGADSEEGVAYCSKCGASLGASDLSRGVQVDAVFGSYRLLQQIGVTFVPDGATTLTFFAVAWVLFGIAACLALPNVHAVAQRLRTMPAGWASPAAAALGVLAAVAACLVDKPSEFLYFNF